MGFHDAYINALRQHLEQEVKAQEKQNKNLEMFNQVKSIGQRFLPAASTAPAVTSLAAASTGAMPTVGGGTMSTLGSFPSLLTGSGSLTGSAAPNVVGGVGTVLGPAAQLTADTGLVAGVPATGVVAPVTGSTVTTTGLGVSGATISGPIIGAGIAVGSSQPGDFLFPVKKHMYGPLSQVYKYGMGGKFLDQWMGKWSPQGAVNQIFGDPFEQEKAAKKSKALKLAMGALNIERNIAKVAGEYNGSNTEGE